MFRNPTARRNARLTRPTATVVVADEQQMTVRRQPSRRSIKQTAIVTSQYGYDW